MNEIIENLEDSFKDFPDNTIIQELQKSEYDIKAGRLISYSDFKEKLRMMYNI